MKKNDIYIISTLFLMVLFLMFNKNEHLKIGKKKGKKIGKKNTMTNFQSAISDMNPPKQNIRDIIPDVKPLIHAPISDATPPAEKNQATGHELVESTPELSTNENIVDDDIVNNNMINEDIVDETIVDEDIIDGDIVDEDVVDEDIIDGDIVNEDVVNTNEPSPGKSNKGIIIGGIVFILIIIILAVVGFVVMKNKKAKKNGPAPLNIDQSSLNIMQPSL
jgi:hypothetical protein